jgi:hypothetical protein
MVGWTVRKSVGFELRVKLAEDEVLTRVHCVITAPKLSGLFRYDSSLNV